MTSLALRFLPNAAFVFGLLVLVERPVLAGDAALPCDCDAGCPSRRPVGAGLVFDDEEHRLWYEARFWGGTCDWRLSWCFSGDSWYDLMIALFAKVPGGAAPEFCTRLWELGRSIGFEWARANDLRRISTDDIEDWWSQLADADDPLPALDAVEAIVHDRLK